MLACCLLVCSCGRVFGRVCLSFLLAHLFVRLVRLRTCSCGCSCVRLFFCVVVCELRACLRAALLFFSLALLINCLDLGVFVYHVCCLICLLAWFVYLLTHVVVCVCFCLFVWLLCDLRVCLCAGSLFVCVFA